MSNLRVAFLEMCGRYLVSIFHYPLEELAAELQANLQALGQAIGVNYDHKHIDHSLP